MLLNDQPCSPAPVWIAFRVFMKRAVTKLPGAVIVGLVLAVVLDTVIQITWKMAVSGISREASLWAATAVVLSSPFFYAAMLVFGAQLWNWLRVLARADLSFAQPFTALSYITVLVYSSRWLHEHVSPVRGVGVSLILAGVFFISRTPFHTNHTDVREPRAPDPLIP
jgi:drug/metabolite transporter (DMT)-like permease